MGSQSWTWLSDSATTLCFVVESVVPQLAGGKAMIKMQVSLALKTSRLPLGIHTARLSHNVTRFLEGSWPWTDGGGRGDINTEKKLQSTDLGSDSLKREVRMWGWEQGNWWSQGELTIETRRGAKMPFLVLSTACHPRSRPASLLGFPKRPWGRQHWLIASRPEL